jgi:hypothetical protein
VISVDSEDDAQVPSPLERPRIVHQSPFERAIVAGTPSL